MDWYYDQQNQLLIQQAREYCNDLISFQDLKEFSVLNVTEYLDSDNPTIAKLILEIEGSVAEVDEDLLTEEEFKNNLQDILKNWRQEPDSWTGSSVPLENYTYASWEPENLTPSLTTYKQAVIA